jgi:hypothetical protein
MNLPLTDNAVTVLEARYLRRDASGQVVEAPEELFRRVARAIAQAESHFGEAKAARRWEETFYESLTSLDFLPNSRVRPGVVQMERGAGESETPDCCSSRHLPRAVNDV